MKRVLLNLLAAKTGGQITRIESFLKIAAYKNRRDIFYVVLLPSGSSINIEPSSNIETLFIDFGEGFQATIKRFYYENFKMHKVYYQFDCDLFLTFSHYLPNINFRKIPSIVGISNLAPFSRTAIREEKLSVKLKLYLLKKSILSSMRRATSIISLSRICSDILISKGIDKKKILTIRNGVSKFWFVENNNSTFEKQKYGKFVLYVSHFYRYKNHIRLVKAFSNLKKELDEDIKMVFIGNHANRKYLTEIKQNIEIENMTNNIFIIDSMQKKELKAFYQNCYTLVFPSLIENSPNVLLESMASGCAISASNYDPMIEHCGNAAIYFDPLDIIAITKSMYRIFSDSNLRESISQLAKHRAAEHSWDNFYTKCTELIHKSL